MDEVSPTYTPVIPLSYTFVEVSDIIRTLGPPDLLVAKAWVGVKCFGGAFFFRDNLLSGLLIVILILLFSPRLLPLLRMLALLSVHQILGGALAVPLSPRTWVLLAGEAGWGVGVGDLLLPWGLVVLLVLGPLPKFRGGLGPGSVRVFAILLHLIRIPPFLCILGGRLLCPFCKKNRAKSGPNDQAAPRVSPEPSFRSWSLYPFNSSKSSLRHP